MADSGTCEWRSGRVQVYTGDGKGKTTAALGLALRAAGAGLKIFIAQFAKGMRSSELLALERFGDCIEARQFGRGQFVREPPSREDIEAARRGIEEVRRILAAGEHRVVILDEANVATRLGLFPVADLLALIEARPPHVELVITGRGAAPEILDRADLVTEMREVKHYYNRGVPARRGIEN
ncbi:MAG: cob(I)yrinic acid a,c-diamide adenosyltransferase [Lentisphaeria bacterium]|nr:cob(I)yrinic acid a,c-diamide adenosyltransferase [Lentisphaeria bacterium]